jgi:tetratricopeptide (TPR) repeat protein
MRRTFLIFFLFPALLSYSQLRWIDSLKEVTFKEKKDSANFTSANLLFAHYLANQIDSAYKYANVFSRLASGKGNQKLLARSYVMFAEVASKTNNYAEQIRHLSKALKLMEDAQMLEGLMVMNLKLSEAFLNSGNINDALYYVGRTEKYFQSKENQQQWIIKSKVNVVYAEAAYRKHNFKVAFDHFSLALQQSEKAWKDEWNLAKIYEGLAKTNAALGDKANAERNYRKAIRLNRETVNLRGLASCEQGLAALYIESNNIDSALIRIRTAESLAKKTLDKDALLEIYNRYIYLYTKLGDHKLKADYLLMRQHLSDSINAFAFNKNFAEAVAGLKSEERERENALLNEKNKVLELEIRNGRSRTLLIISIALIIVISLLSWSAYAKLRSQKKRMELEQQLLRSQMNPHFIFNALSSIQSFILSEDPIKSAKYLSTFSKLIRAIFENSKHEVIPLSEEVDTLKFYLELESLRNSNLIQYKFDLVGIKETTMVPSMLIQPYLENAVKHAFGDLSLENKGEINVSFNMKGKNLYCTIEDNGKGIKSICTKKDVAHRSSGIEITSKRLKFLCKHMGFEYDLLVQDKSEIGNGEHGTLVSFLLPYKR